MWPSNRPPQGSRPSSSMRRNFSARLASSVCSGSFDTCASSLGSLGGLDKDAKQEVRLNLYQGFQQTGKARQPAAIVSGARHGLRARARTGPYDTTKNHISSQIVSPA